MSMKAFGERLNALRKAQGMTQEQLASRLGVTNQSVSKWELGVCYPDTALLPELGQVFGVTVDALFGILPSGDADGISRQLGALFARTPEQEVYALAVRLAGKLHEGVCTLGYKQRVPWQIHDDLGGLDWGFSAQVEPEGASARCGRTVFFSAQGDAPLLPHEMNKLARTLSSLGNADVLRVLLILEVSKAQTVAELAERCGLPIEAVAQAVQQLPLEETAQGFQLAGHYAHVPQLLRLFSLFA